MLSDTAPRASMIAQDDTRVRIGHIPHGSKSARLLEPQQWRHLGLLQHEHLGFVQSGLLSREPNPDPTHGDHSLHIYVNVSVCIHVVYPFYDPYHDD